jgi:flagellar M-ring protein FliF
MAIAIEDAGPPNVFRISQSAFGRNFLMMAGIAAIIAVMVVVWMWSQRPDYRVLFANFSDRDGGSIVASLQQLNIPYKFADGGGAILVPADQVYDARLKLAAQGLPKGGNVGFELMENQKLGVSQFLEQVNFQRALEGELAQSIQSIGAVDSARVHLALPKASVFVREQQKPTASVLLNLRQGRTLDQGQVSAIVHLVASSVPELPPGNVTVVDQTGNLLSETSKHAGNNTLDPTQLKYVQDMQQNIVHRIESIITPIVGLNNVRAEATVDIDFSTSEQAAEIYKPNQTPTSSSIRSQQSSETQSGTSTTASGVPGALSNQAPAPSTAPLTAPATGGTAVAAAPTGNTHKDTTVNYEVDKTIRYVQQPMGGLKRQSVAVVVNYKQLVSKTGKVSQKALTDEEKTQISDLVKEAIGYNKDRGDTINILNSPFATPPKEVIEDIPIWKRPETLILAKEVGKYIIGISIIFYLFFGMLKPMLNRLSKDIKAAANRPPVEDTVVQLDNHRAPRDYQENLNAAKALARQDPKMVASVVKAWVGGGNE